MASLLSPSSVEGIAHKPRGHGAREVPKSDLLLVAGSDEGLVRDFVGFAGRRGAYVVLPECMPTSGALGPDLPSAMGAVIFLGRRSTSRDEATLDAVADIARHNPVYRVCLVTSFAVHFSDAQAMETESRALRRFKDLAVRPILFRTSPVLSPNSRASASLRSLWFCHPLLPRRLTSCCVDSEELFTAIEQELGQPRAGPTNTYTMLGPNCSWRSLLKSHKDRSLPRHAIALLAIILSLLCVGPIARLLLHVLAKWRPRLRSWNFSTIYPGSTRELLAIYNKYNFRHVKIVGYNNGVVHFGQKHPGRTIVSTVCCGKRARVHGNVATFDGGVLLRDATQTLNRAGREFYVLPNYSYVSVGTSFFIPIHGSASRYSTMGETIEKVLLYDPTENRFLSCTRDDPEFRDAMYNLKRNVLLLRAHFRVKDKSLYYMKHTKLENPTSHDILAAFQDSEAANVEIRKPRADSPAIEINKYYTAPPTEAEALLLPRDSLGRLWDKLEANRLTSFLFHWLVRSCAHHVELFLTAEEFAVFWETHASLPIKKIQLRYIKRDGLPHSPFREHDCISADMFMLRKHRPKFEAYLKERFRAVQFNPGKHSM